MLGSKVTKEGRTAVSFISQCRVFRGVCSIQLHVAILYLYVCPCSMEDLPPITALAFRDSLNMAVGTATGQVDTNSSVL